jgi:hypothetical protein
MPKVLEKFPAANSTRYAWDDLLDGRPWELTAGEDFNGRVETFRANASLQARKRGGKVRTRHLKSDDGPDRLVVMFVAANA